VNRLRGWRLRTWWMQLQRSMRPLPVVVRRVLDEDAAQIAVVGDDPELEVPMAHKGGALAIAVTPGSSTNSRSPTCPGRYGPTSTCRTCACWPICSRRRSRRSVRARTDVHLAAVTAPGPQILGPCRGSTRRRSGRADPDRLRGAWAAWLASGVGPPAGDEVGVLHRCAGLHDAVKSLAWAGHGGRQYRRHDSRHL
jgi:hypothetical protein